MPAKGNQLNSFQKKIDQTLNFKIKNLLWKSINLLFYFHWKFIAKK
jgi:hypothetical protein